MQRRQPPGSDDTAIYPASTAADAWHVGNAGMAVATAPPDARRGNRPRLDASNQAERTALATELAGMADQINQIDPRSGARMADLASAIGTETGRQHWADVDLRRAFQTDRLATAYAVRVERGYVSPMVVMADRVRNVLVLVPIFLTWFALAEASRAYSALLTDPTADPNLAGQSFLFLWEQGFMGHASPLAPSFSTVALIDAVLIGLIIVLTFFTHGRREAREDTIEATANLFQGDLDNMLSEAGVMLAGDRGSRPERLAMSVERLAERFERNSDALLGRLRVEHERLEQLANRREREFADFGIFASGMRAGAEETHRLVVELRQISEALQAALEDLTSEVSSTTDQQRMLLGAVQGLERLTTTTIQSDQAVTRQIGSAAQSLAETAERSLTSADTASQAARVATEAMRGIGEIAQQLATSQARLETAFAGEIETNTRLADALRGSAGGVTASTRILQEVGGALTQLRDELGRLAGQNIDQAKALRALLEDQATIAGGLNKMMQDASKITIATAQRQDAVTNDIALLLNRLESVTTVLGRAAQQSGGALTPESMERALTNALRNELGAQAEQIAAIVQGKAPDADPNARRNDPNRLWPQRRS